MKKSEILLFYNQFSGGSGFALVYLDDVNSRRQIRDAEFSWAKGGLKYFFAQNVKDGNFFVQVIFWGNINFAIAHGIWVQTQSFNGSGFLKFGLLLCLLGREAKSKEKNQ